MRREPKLLTSRGLCFHLRILMASDIDKTFFYRIFVRVNNFCFYRAYFSFLGASFNLCGYPENVYFKEFGRSRSRTEGEVFTASPPPTDRPGYPIAQMRHRGPAVAKVGLERGFRTESIQNELKGPRKKGQYFWIDAYRVRWKFVLAASKWFLRVKP